MSGKKPRRPSRSELLRMNVRGLWPDHNPLRRASDRAEALLVGTLLVLFFIGAPLTALLAGQWAAHSGAHELAAQRGAHYQVTAVLLSGAPYESYGWDYSQARARWTAPDGARRTGEVDAPMGTPRGRTVRIWTDRSGQVIGAPIRAAQVTSEAVLAAVIAPLTLAFVLASAGALAHQVMERRRLAAWDADWRATGPQWTRQR